MNVHSKNDKILEKNKADELNRRLKREQKEDDFIHRILEVRNRHNLLRPVLANGESNVEIMDFEEDQQFYAVNDMIVVEVGPTKSIEDSQAVYVDDGVEFGNGTEMREIAKFGEQIRSDDDTATQETNNLHHKNFVFDDLLIDHNKISVENYVSAILDAASNNVLSVIHKVKAIMDKARTDPIAEKKSLSRARTTIIRSETKTVVPKRTTGAARHQNHKKQASVEEVYQGSDMKALSSSYYLKGVRNQKSLIPLESRRYLRGVHNLHQFGYSHIDENYEKGLKLYEETPISGLIVNFRSMDCNLDPSESVSIDIPHEEGEKNDANMSVHDVDITAGSMLLDDDDEDCDDVEDDLSRGGVETTLSRHDTFDEAASVGSRANSHGSVKKDLLSVKGSTVNSRSNSLVSSKSSVYEGNILNESKSVGQSLGTGSSSATLSSSRTYSFASLAIDENVDDANDSCDISVPKSFATLKKKFVSGADLSVIVNTTHSADLTNSNSFISPNAIDAENSYNSIINSTSEYDGGNYHFSQEGIKPLSPQLNLFPKVPTTLKRERKFSLFSSIEQQKSAITEYQRYISKYRPYTHVTSLSKPLTNNTLFYLEIVSISENIYCDANRIILNQENIMLGSHSRNDYVLKNIHHGSNTVVSKNGVGPDGIDVLKTCCISDIHCILHTPLLHKSRTVCKKKAMEKNGLYEDEEEEDLPDENNPHLFPTVLDNHSMWGTYLVSAAGVTKISTVSRHAMVISPGNLLCLGLCRNGPKNMLPSEANQALIVFRLRYFS